MSGFLLDTQIVLWGALDRRRLSRQAVRIIREERVFVSVASLWEIATKQQIGKFILEIDLAVHLQEYDFEELPITWQHARCLMTLPLIHRDPFDRILAAQALTDDLVLVTADEENLARYPIRTVF